MSQRCGTLAPPTAEARATAAVLRRCGGRTCPPGICDHDATLRRSPDGSRSATAPPAVHQTLASPGEALDAGARAYLEPRFGHDFSRVRVHSGADAAASAAAVGARAYTVGSHIAFGSGAYAPGTDAGRRLIAHELAHVLQQRHSSPAVASAGLAVGTVDDPTERHAEQAADAVMAGANPPTRTLLPGGAVRRACPTPPTGVAATPLKPFPCATAGPEMVGGDIVQFCQDSTELLELTTWVKDVVQRSRTATRVEIHGNASVDGPSAEYNRTLACMRARAFRDVLVARSVTTPTTLVAHDPTTAYGPPHANRNVTLLLTQPAPTTTPTDKPKPTPSSVPDAEYGPSGVNCDRYRKRDVAEYLGGPYLGNAFTACVVTPNEPHNNRVRKCLQRKLSAYLDELKRQGAPKARDDFTLEVGDRVLRCSDIWLHHVECYAESGCENTFIDFKFFFPLCDREFPLAVTAQAIKKFNPCMGPRTQLPDVPVPYMPTP